MGQIIENKKSRIVETSDWYISDDTLGIYTEMDKIYLNSIDLFSAHVKKSKWKKNLL